MSWAGEADSAGWFDVGREFTELWHHQEQIRLAVGAPSLDDGRYLRATLEIALRGLPYAFREAACAAGQTLLIDISGPSGGTWTLVRDADRWTLYQGMPASATTRVRLSDTNAWKLLFNALSQPESAVAVEGDRALAGPLLSARSVIV